MRAWARKEASEKEKHRFRLIAMWTGERAVVAPFFQICVFLYRFISNRYIVRVERRLCDVRWRAWDFFHCSAGFDLSLCAVCSRFLHFISIQLLHNTSLALAATLLSCHNWSTFILFFWYLFCTCFLFSSTFLPFYFCHVGYYLMLCHASSLNSFCFHPHTHTHTNVSEYVCNWCKSERYFLEWKEKKKQRLIFFEFTRENVR